LVEKIKVASRVGFTKVRGPLAEIKPVGAKSRIHPPQAPNKIVAIGISTGGPVALQFVLSQIPSDFPGVILVVQHMPEGFTEMFAKRLDELSPVEVHEAKSGDLLLAGRVLVCPGNRHMMVRRMPRGDMVVLADSPQVNGHRPSVDVLFHSVAQEFGNVAIGVIMTGMGEDGAEGIGAIKAAGGLTIAQSEETCVVGGMPRAAISKGFINRVIPLEGLASALLHHCGGDRIQADRAPVSANRS